MVMEIRAPSHSSSGLNVTTSPEYKLIVVGPRRVGKSALVVRFLTKRFINEYLENTEMTCAGKVCVDGELLRVNIQDSSEKSMRTTSLDHYCRWADAIMLVFSITDAESFNQLKTVLNRLMERKSEKFVTPIVLIGNKCDLDNTRKVTKDEALDLARLLQCDYYESSAREGSMTLLSSSNDVMDDDFDYRLLRDRKRSNSADECMKGGLLGMMDRASFEMPIKRWSSQSSLGHGLRVPTVHNNTSAASSENESDCDEHRRQHKHQSRSTARAKKLLKAAGKLSPLFSRRMSPANADKKRRNRCDANNNRNRNNNKRDNSPSRKTIPGLVVNSLRLTGSVCAIGSVTNGDLLGVSTADLELPASDYITNNNDDSLSDAWQRRRRSAVSSESSSTLGNNDGTYCAQPFIQLCREALRRRTYKSVLALSGKSNCAEQSANFPSVRTDVCRSPSQAGFHALSLLT